MSEIVPGKRLAVLFDVTSRTVTDWRKAGMPVHEDKGRGRETKYDTGDCFRWLLARDNGGAKDPGTMAARRRLIEAQAGREELRLAKERGEVAVLSGIAQAWGRLIGNCRARLLGIPTKATPVVYAAGSMPEVYRVLTDMIHEALNELSNMNHETSNSSEREAEK